MADLATLGLAVDSSQVKTATAELDKLSTAATKTGVSTAALEAGAKRLGISVEEYRKRVEGAVPATEQLGAAARAQAAAWAALQPVLSGVSGQLLALSAGAGPVGVFLSALGPWGVAASVGIGALSSAFNAMIEGANHIGDKSVEIKKFSDVTGLTVGQIKGLTSAGAALGVSSDQVTAAVERFSVGLDEAHKSTGPLFDKLREINPQLARQLSETRTTAQGWDILSQAIRDTNNEAQRNALLRAAFGRGGLEAGLVAISSANAGGLDAQAEKISKATGLTAQWVAETARLRNENIQLEKSITTMMESAYALPVLQRQNEFLRVQKEIAAAILATGRTPEGVRVGPTGEPEMSPTPDIPDIPQAPSVGVGGENARTSLREMTAMANARNEELQATVRQNNLDKERIGILGDLIGVDQKVILQMNELKAARLGGKISEEDQQRANALLEPYLAKLREVQATYGGIQLATSIALSQQNDQLRVAEAVTAAEKMLAQEAATYNALILQRVPPEDALRRAKEQTVIAQAAANAAADAQLLTLKDQQAVVGAVTDDERMRAQYVATTNRLINQGVDAYRAEAVALQEMQNTQQATWAQEQRQWEEKSRREQETQAANERAVQSTQQITSLVNDQEAAYERMWQAKQAAFGQLGDIGELGTSGKKTGPISIYTMPERMAFADAGGMGNVNVERDIFGRPLNITPKTSGWEKIINDMLMGGGSTQDAIGKVLGRGPITQDTAGILRRLTELQPEEQQKSVIERELDQVRRQPATLAREELIKQLTDSLKQLQDSTDSLNDTMKITLDPLFTGGHSALRIGFYNEGGSAGGKYYQDTAGLPTARGVGPTGTVPATGPRGITPGISLPPSMYLAGGFDGVVTGGSGTDDVPFHAMLSRGEHISVRTPDQARNDARPSVAITQVINFPRDAVGERRRTYRQLSEGFAAIQSRSTGA